MSETEVALGIISGFLASFFHEERDYERATQRALEHLNRYGEYRHEVVSAFETLFTTTVPAATITRIVQQEANRYIRDDDQARAFLVDVFQDAVRPAEERAAQSDEDDVESEQPQPARGVEEAITDLAAANPLVRAAAARDLALHRAPVAVEPLLAALGDPNPPVVEAAAQALWLIGDQRAVAPLIGLLDSPHESLRAAAALGLGYLKPKQAVKPLLQRLDDPSPFVRLRAGLALASLGAPAVDPLLRLLAGGHHADEALSALVAMEEAVVQPALIRALEDHDAGIRVQATRVLIQKGGLMAVEALRQARHDPDDEVRHYAKIALDVIAVGQAAEPTHHPE